MIFQLKHKADAGKYITMSSGDGRLAAMVLFTWDQLMSLTNPSNQFEYFEGKKVQRRLNKARARKFADYMYERMVNKERFVIPPIVLNVLPPGSEWYEKKGKEPPEQMELPYGDLKQKIHNILVSFQTRKNQSHQTRTANHPERS